MLPGTHSNWVQLQQGRQQGFATRMTGEQFALRRERSVLGRLRVPNESFDDAAFMRGVAAARRCGSADLGRLLFGVRTLGRFGELPATGLADGLSGLLIGAAVAAGALVALGPLQVAQQAGWC